MIFNNKLPVWRYNRLKLSQSEAEREMYYMKERGFKMELSLMTFTMTGDVITRKMDINKICKLADKYSIRAIDIIEM